MKKPYKNNKFKISGPTRIQEFDGAYAVLDIKD